MQVDRKEAEGPEAEEAISRITQEGPSTSQEDADTPPLSFHTSKPTTSAIAEHDAAFPAIGSMNGVSAPAKAAAANGSASVVVTIGDESVAPGALDAALETAPSSVSVSFTVGEDGEDVLVALSLDSVDRYVEVSVSHGSQSHACMHACVRPCMHTPMHVCKLRVTCYVLGRHAFP